MSTRQGLLWQLSRVFIVAVIFNYFWELGQSQLYVGMENLSEMWRHCLVPSLADGLLVLLIFAAGWWIFGKRDWFERPDVNGYVLMLAVGLAIGIGGEWIAVNVLRLWSYTPRMPLVPLLNIGLTPVVQMTLLPPVIFRVAAAWHNRALAD